MSNKKPKRPTSSIPKPTNVDVKGTKITGTSGKPISDKSKRNIK